MTKRALDLVGSLLGLLLTLPLWPAIAIAIKIDNPGPIIFKGVRMGRGGAPFTIYKFRTMIDMQGSGITRSDDRRITRVGRLLRKSKLDEIPQLVNVLKGDMSLVGPRPEDPRYLTHYTTEQREVLQIRPGLTSPTSIAYRHEEELLASSTEDAEQAYISKILPAKLAMDLEYVRHRSFWMDLGILGSTLRAIVARNRG